MPRLDYKTCRECKGHVSQVGPLSHTRLCVPCAIRRATENDRDISRKSGPWFDYWRRQMAACVGARLPD